MFVPSPKRRTGVQLEPGCTDTSVLVLHRYLLGTYWISTKATFFLDPSVKSAG